MATKWGIVSTGRISSDFVNALRTLPAAEHEVVAVAARRSDDSRAFAEKLQIPNWYGSYEELANNKDIEVVYIAIVNSLHYSVGRLMLEHGKHVLMEKPMCLTLEDCDDLMDLAKKKKLFLMEALWSRFLPSYEYMMKELKGGTVGDIISVSCSLGFLIPDGTSIRKRDLGGSAVMKAGIYCLNAISLAFDHEWPEKICAVGHLNQEGVDETVSVSLQYSNGRVASFTTSSNVKLPCELHISGTKEMIKLPKTMFRPTMVYVGDKIIDFPLPDTPTEWNYENAVGLRYQAAEVRHCVREGLLESPKMSHAHTKHLQMLMGEICRQLGVSYPSAKCQNL